MLAVLVVDRIFWVIAKEKLDSSGWLRSHALKSVANLLLVCFGWFLRSSVWLLGCSGWSLGGYLCFLGGYQVV